MAFVGHSGLDSRDCNEAVPGPVDFSRKDHLVAKPLIRICFKCPLFRMCYWAWFCTGSSSNNQPLSAVQDVLRLTKAVWTQVGGIVAESWAFRMGLRSLQTQHVPHKNHGDVCFRSSQPQIAPSMLSPCLC